MSWQKKLTVLFITLPETGILTLILPQRKISGVKLMEPLVTRSPVSFLVAWIPTFLILILLVYRTVLQLLLIFQLTIFYQLATPI